jgi:hypothetical protein
MARITKEHARKIARKLRAVIDKTPKAHDVAKVYHGGTLIAAFGIRRGSNKNLGHDHIATELHLSPHDTLRLANCPLSRDEWIEMLIKGGWIEA